ncbi:MAG TPA: cyclic pyranopterin monophosphate synthase MoaC [Gemmatimonadaceae bacterium]
MRDLTHAGKSGEVRMVDVGEKPETLRVATAKGAIVMRAETLAAIRQNRIAKGEVLATARIAGILAAKRTSELIPLCHALQLTDVSVDFSLDDALPGVRVDTRASTVGRTGVEMEALTAAAVALLTVYDMAKGIDREMRIVDVELVAKSGGQSGDWTRT